MKSDEFVGLIAVIGAFLCGFMGLLLAFTWQWVTHRRSESLDALKRDMLQRGMSAQEICMVLEAGDPEIAKLNSAQT